MNARIIMVLHSHIPYVKRQGRWPFGEVWLFEAMAETYVPLIINLLKLDEEGKQTPYYELQPRSFGAVEFQVY